MKSFKIEIIKCLQNDVRGKYYILLPYRQRVFFKNKKHAESSVRLLKKLIFDTINTLRSLQIRLMSLYGDYYLQLNSTISSKIVNSLHQFNKQIDFTFYTYTKGNQSISFEKVYILFDNLFDINDNLKKFSKSKNSHSNLLAQTNSISKQLELLLKNYRNELKCNNNEINYRNIRFKVVHLKSNNLLNA